MSEGYSIDKLTAVAVHLEAATLLVLRDESPEAAHTLISAARRVLWDLSKSRPNDLIESIEGAVVRLVKPGYEKAWRKYERRASNFFKHADQDPTAKLEGIMLGKVNDLELLLCSLAYGIYSAKLTPRLTIALCHCGFRSGDWFDFRGYVKAVSGSEFDYDYYSRLRESDRVRLFLKAYDQMPPTQPKSRT